MRLLIIDDNARERQLTIAALVQSIVNIDIIEIGSAEAFAEVFAQADFDLVITEYKLAWIDGLSLFKTIKSRFACIPIIMLTDFGNEEIAVAAIKIGMTDYFSKHNRHKLVESVKHCLLEAAEFIPCSSIVNNIQLCEKWDLAISRLTSDFAYSMRINVDGKPVFEWATSPLTKLIPASNSDAREPGDPLIEFGLPIHPDDIVLVKKRFANLWAGYEDISEYRIISAQGEIRYFKDHAQPIRDWSTGKLIRIYGAIQDITDRKHAEDKLYLMQRAMDCSNNGIIITDLADNDYAIIYANDAFVNLTGYSLDKLLGQNPRILQNSDRDQPNLNEIRISLAAGRETDTVLRNYRQDGSMFWNEVYISPIKDQSGVITHYVGIQNDVSNRVKMKESLINSEERYRTLFENAVEAIFVNRGGNKIEEVNQACLRLWRANNPQELLDKEPLELFHPACQTIIKNRMKAIVEDKVALPFIEQKIIRLDGTIADVLVSAHPFVDDQGPLIYVTLLDISELKQAEAALQESKVRYQELSNHLELVREEERTRIAREIHDDLGSFLTVLKMDLSWLEKHLPANLKKCRERTVKMAQQTLYGIETVKRIITDLRPSILDQLGLLPAIDWLVENFREQTGIDCTLTVPKNQYEMIDVDRSTVVFRIAQEALMNITAHAKASRVLVDIEIVNKNLLLTITDNGCGMPVSKINQSQGFGITGMSERARHFGGQLTINSQPETGTSIRLSLPLKDLKLEKNND